MGNTEPNDERRNETKRTGCNIVLRVAPRSRESEERGRVEEEKQREEKGREEKRAKGNGRERKGTKESKERTRNLRKRTNHEEPREEEDEGENAERGRVEGRRSEQKKVRSSSAETLKRTECPCPGEGEAKRTEEKRRREKWSSRAEPSEAEEPALPSSPSTSPPGSHRPGHTDTRLSLHHVAAYTRAHRGVRAHKEAHLDSPYPPCSSVRTTRLRTVYTTVRQGRGSPLRRRARRSPPRARDTLPPSYSAVLVSSGADRSHPWTSEENESVTEKLKRVEGTFCYLSHRYPDSRRL